MKKKILCLALSVLLIFGLTLVGCRKQEESKKADVTVSVGSAEAKVGDTVTFEMANEKIKKVTFS